MSRARLVLVVVLAGCGGDDGAETKPPPPPMPGYLVDAAAEATPTVLPSYDPASGYHLDDAEGGTAARRTERTAPRERRVLQLMLKSTPSGALAAVDGKVLGRTPLFWEGEFTGREREFTFVLPGYTMARYRFVPIKDGFVHGRLEKVSTDGDAGVPVIPSPPQPGDETYSGPAPSSAAVVPERPPPRRPSAPPPGPAITPSDAGVVSPAPPPAAAPAADAAP